MTECIRSMEKYNFYRIELNYLHTFQQDNYLNKYFDTKSMQQHMMYNQRILQNNQSMDLDIINKLFHLQMGRFLHNNQVNIQKRSQFPVIYMVQNNQCNQKSYLSNSYNLSYNLYMFLNKIEFLEDNSNNISYYKADKRANQKYTQSNKLKNCKFYNIADN